MRFKDIKINADGVTLTRVDSLPDGTVLEQNLKNATPPLPEFATALQAFTGFAVNLVGVPKEWADTVNVVSIHLSEEPKTRRRGLVVTFTNKIERAKNRVVVINTPLMHQPTEDADGTSPGTFEREVMNMIVEAEAQAKRYWNGDRAQGDMFSGGEGGGRKKGRKGKGGDQPLDDEGLRKLLLQAGRDVPIDAIARLTSNEREAANVWATAVIGEIPEAERPEEPAILMKLATPALA